MSEPKTGEDKNKHMVKMAMVEALTQVLQDPKIYKPIAVCIARQTARAMIFGLILTAILIATLAATLTNK